MHFHLRALVIVELLPYGGLKTDKTRVRVYTHTHTHEDDEKMSKNRALKVQLCIIYILTRDFNKSTGEKVA